MRYVAAIGPTLSPSGSSWTAIRLLRVATDYSFCITEIGVAFTALTPLSTAGNCLVALALDGGTNTAGTFAAITQQAIDDTAAPSPVTARTYSAEPDYGTLPKNQKIVRQWFCSYASGLLIQFPRTTGQAIGRNLNIALMLKSQQGSMPASGAAYVEYEINPSSGNNFAIAQ